jgi:hypothetical protein
MALLASGLPTMCDLLYRFLGSLRDSATKQAASCRWQREWIDQSNQRDLTAPLGRESRDWCEKRCRFPSP